MNSNSNSNSYVRHSLDAFTFHWIECMATNFANEFQLKKVLM